MDNKLEYEYTPIQPTIIVKKKEPRVKIRSTFIYHLEKIRYTFRPKSKKKLTKAQRKLVEEQRKRVIMGIGQLLVVVSIAYSTTIILIGVDTIESKIALLPAVIFAFVTLIKSFSKLYK